MSAVAQAAAHAAVPGAPTTPESLVIAEPDRRFYAFAIDRAIGWTVLAGVGVAMYFAFFRDGRWIPGLAGVVAAAAIVWLVSALLLGLGGTTPGRSAVGLKVLDPRTGRPIGLGRALTRQLILGVCTLPTLGFGAAMLAWMATVDPSGNRRGWHDKVGGSVVVDIRPPRVVTEETTEEPRRVINLTAMRLQPSPAAAESSSPPTPPRRSEAATATGAAPVAADPATVTSAVPEHRDPATSAPGTSAPAASAPAEEQPAPPPTLLPGVSMTPAAPAAAPTPPPVSAGSPPPAAQQPYPHAPSAPGHPSAPDLPAAGRHAAIAGAWRVTFDTGESLVVAGLALIGRGPEPKNGEQAAHLVALTSTDMSLSKTHGQVQLVADGSLVVMDRGSTNGSSLIRQGVSRSLGAHKPATLREGDRVRFGDREMRVSREP